MFRSLIATIMLSFASTQGASIKKDAPLYKEVNETTQISKIKTRDNTSHYQEINLNYNKIQTINGSWAKPYNNQFNWFIFHENSATGYRPLLWYNYYTKYEKFKATSNNNSWTINSYIYNQTGIKNYRTSMNGENNYSLYMNCYGSYHQGGLFFYNTGEKYDNEINSTLLIFELIPNNRPLATDMYLDFTWEQWLNIIAPTYIPEDYPVDDGGPYDAFLNIRQSILLTTDNYASKYVDYNINTSTNLKGFYNDIKTNTNYTEDMNQGSNYIASLYMPNEIINDEDTNRIWDESIDIQGLGIDNTKTNYLYILIQRGMEITETNYRTSYYPGDLLKITNRDVSITRSDLTWAVYNNIEFDVDYVLTPKQEIVDIPGLMFQILGMPFQFYSTAFNITWFPGTAYEINISNIIFTILGCLIFIFVIRLILKVFK